MSGFLNTMNNAVAQIQQPIAAAAAPYLQKITETAQQAAQPTIPTKQGFEGFGQRMSLLEISLIILLVLLICSAYANSKN